MHGKFRLKQDIETQDIGIAVLSWICHPDSTGAQNLTLLEGRFAPGQGHSFHKHPDQEEILYIVAGRIELWIEQERRILQPGEAAFMPAGTVHAAFNAADTNSRLLAILGPSAGESGLEMVDVSGEAPWRELRAEPVAG
jgi:quercetin dioxygenase-like cupin family protein